MQLPPIGYQPTQYPPPPSAGVPQQPLPEYGASHMYPSYQPHSPYAQTSQGIYNQCKCPSQLFDLGSHQGTKTVAHTIAANGGQPPSH